MSPDLEVAHIPYERGGPYPGIYMYSQPARMIRPVLQMESGARELIGTLEQIDLNIRCGLANTDSNANAVDGPCMHRYPCDRHRAAHHPVSSQKLYPEHALRVLELGTMHL